MSLAVLFPGQGSQTVGMGAGLFTSQHDLLVDAADEILGWSLREVCLDGPEERLTRTEYAQPALFAVSYALWSELRSRVDFPVSGAAGHSLGEFTALTAAESLSFRDALAVVAARGRAMAAAADIEPSGMAALIGADAALAGDVASKRKADGGRLEVANVNAPGQVVVAGGAEDIEWVVDNVRDLGVRKAIPLKVAGAFHTRFMEPAANQVGEALAGVVFRQPDFPVWSNTTAKPHSTHNMAATLRSQMVSTVRFADCLTDMASSGVDTFLHVGPGDVTAAMARRTVEGASTLVVSSPDDIDDVAESLVSIG
jgi:[acyl-carrier-protein] S-malonyltransferase